MSPVESLAFAFSSSPGLSVTIALVGVIFLWSGAAKLRRPNLTALTLVDFGVVKGRHPAAAIGFSAGEVALGVWLLSGYAPLPAVSLATALLASFVFLIGRSLAAGAQFACFCFGQSGSTLSVRTLWRTLTLALASGFVTYSVVATSWGGRRLDVQAILLAISLILVGRLLAWGPKLLSWNSDPYAVGVVVD